MKHEIRDSVNTVRSAEIRDLPVQIATIRHFPLLSWIES